MADFKLANANAKEVWSTKYATEYVALSGLLPFMSSASNAIFRVNTDLANNGDLVHIPYFASLKGAGVSGGATLEGNEEALLNYSTGIKVRHRRNAVMLAEHESFRTELDVANIAKGGLKDWSAEDLRNELIEKMQNVVIAGGVDSDGTPVEDTYKTFAASTATERTNYMLANADRIIMGTAKPTTAVFSTSLAAVAAGAILTADTVSLAKEMAETTTNFRITPYMTKDGQKWYVMFVGVEGFRQLRKDPRIEAANRDARPREVETNPLFNGGDLVWDGVIVKKIPEIKQVGDLGAAGAPIGFAALCGANTLGIAFARKPTFRTEKKDYDHKIGVGITEVRGSSKMSAAGTQTGMVSIYYAA
ncbi:DUF4043 family protein [Sphingomonas sp. S1-29]|uniref:phage capsid family protein n=1 Tax=Sphingomonas sp. S1-29 TaxID=2991074 RepID=UPI00223ED477|nr:DUF4043 family protein [Sphingomonas sp. S1-29]UZK69597.1 DUF4043 family protein [Sphingomonas sp. S1-29]